MKKSILELGRALSKVEQKQISGGREVFRTPCDHLPGDKCCYTVESHITDEVTGVDHWVKEKVCIGGFN